MVFIDSLIQNLINMAGHVAVAMPLFALLAVLFKRRYALKDLTEDRRHHLLNIKFLMADWLLVAPLIGIVIAFITALFGLASWPQDINQMLWAPMGIFALIPALFIADFAGYWRHRLLHSRKLWPVHAIHHSDEALSWLSLYRFHPFNRVITSTVNILVLAGLGFSPEVIILNSLARLWYGYFIHADIPLSYGVLDKVFVSPIMHRWHHVRDIHGQGANFATIFSLWDHLFNSYWVPSKAVPPLGINEAPYPQTMSGQYLRPFIHLQGPGQPRTATPQSPDQAQKIMMKEEV